MTKAKQYIENGGSHCPHCGSRSISGGHVEILSNEAWQEVVCDECSQEWLDLYTLTGVSLDDTVTDAPSSPQDHTEEIDPAWGKEIVENYKSHAIEMVQARLQNNPREYHSWRAHFMGASPRWMALHDGEVYDPKNDPNRDDKGYER